MRETWARVFLCVTLTFFKKITTKYHDYHARTKKVLLCSHLFIGSKQNTNTKNSFVFALSLHQTISENSAFWPKHKK